MKKITITGSFPFTNEQKTRLEALGEVKTVTNYSSSEEWLSAIQGSDVILSDGDYLYENLENLENVFVTYPYIELGAFDSEKLKAKGVYVANAKGGNRNSIVEWVIFVTLSLFRKFPKYLRTSINHEFTRHSSLEGKKVLIIGKGSIGTGVGEALEALKMKVEYFVRGDDLKMKSKDADLIVNALNCNSSSKNLLNEEFFLSLNPGSYYVTFARPYTYDIEGVIKSIDRDILAGAGIDCDPEPLFDTTNAFYQKCIKNEKILVTPHVAGITKEAGVNGLEIAIQNIEAYLSGEPQNILTKV
jgi:phosphoglycerate dehydrogenase-like enzyme